MTRSMFSHALWLLSVGPCLVGMIAPASAQTSPLQVTVAGRVTQGERQEPVEGAIVEIEGTSLSSLTTSEGHFLLLGVPPGPHVMRVTRIGFATRRLSLNVPAEGVLELAVRLAPRALELEGLVVTADPAGRARGELGTSSVVEQEAIRHVTATSLADLMFLIPGVELLPPDVTTSRTLSLRTAPTSGTGASNASDLAAFGTLIVLDGVPLSNNVNLQGAGGGGVDLRRIPANTLERVEVIRGVPSARYGDLTQGAVIIDTRAGRIQPEVQLQHDARTSEVSVVWGDSLGGGHLASMTTDFARSRSAPGLSSDVSERTAFQVAHRVATGGPRPSLVIDTRVDGFELTDDRPENPNVRPGWSFFTRERGLRASVRARRSFDSDRTLTLTTSLGRVSQESRSLVPKDRPAQPLTTRMTEGREIGQFVEGHYTADFGVRGAPTQFYSRLEAEMPLSFRGTSTGLRAGMELRREWNHAAGISFDAAFPPYQTFNGVRGFARPRAFDDPPLVTSAFYLDDRFSVSLPGDLGLNVQGGIRVDLLHRGSGWLSGIRDAVVQPRLNLEFLASRWLRLRAGWGLTAKLSPLRLLHPTRQYYDVVNVNWFAPDPAERLAVLTTFIVDRENEAIGFSRARKAEVGVEIDLGSLDVSLLVFHDRIRDAAAVLPEAGHILRDLFQLNDSTLGTGRPPEIIEPPYAADTIPILVERPHHHVRQTSEGFEFTALFPEVPALKTRFQIQGAWIRTTQESEALDFGPATAFGDFQLLAHQERAPYWRGAMERGERVLLTYRAIHHQPALGLIITATVQHNVMDRIEDIGGTDALSFEGYVTRAGELIPVSMEERAQPEYNDLRRSRTGLVTTPLTTPADWFLSVQVSKTLPMDGRLSFWAYNVLDNPGRFHGPDVRRRPYSGMRFGLEATVSVRALIGATP